MAGNFNWDARTKWDAPINWHEPIYFEASGCRGHIVSERDHNIGTIMTLSAPNGLHFDYFKASGDPALGNSARITNVEPNTAAAIERRDAKRAQAKREQIETETMHASDLYGLF